MVIDYKVCDICKQGFPDCCEFYWCDCGKLFCCKGCAIDGGFDSIDDYDCDDTTCKYCRNESVEDEELLKFALEKLKLTKFELEKLCLKNKIK